ncbi:MAG: histidine kinase dimerization/phosphoacceptor domain -containing protein [Candidatus Omnitrophota bacterium]
MKEKEKTKEELTAELTFLRQQVSGLKMLATGRKRIEETLRGNEERFRTIVELTSDWVWEVDENGRYIYVSSRITDFLGYTPVEVIGKTPTDLMSSEEAERVSLIFTQIVAKRETFTFFESKNIHKDGHEVIFENSGMPIFDAERNFKGYRGVKRDITERRRMEDEVKNSLTEKEILLKEIHHRVKNNLQTVSGLLYLQSLHTKTEEALAILNDSRNRIRAMALIHEKLYQSKSYAQVDFGEYLKELAVELMDSCQVSPARIKVNVEAKGIFLGIDTAIPCGLITQELISNALKHAFPEKSDGEINLYLCREDRSFILVVRDNGVGFPEGLDFKSTPSLGLQLVNKLVAQIGGSIELRNEERTEFRIIFPTGG